MRKTIRNMFMQSLRVAFTAAFVVAWMYTALPSLFSFPPKIQEARAAIGLVQHTSSFTSIGSLALAYPSNNTAGDLLIIAAGGPVIATFTISDTLGNTYIMAT